MRINKADDLSFLVLRIALGVVFVAHGAQKLFGAWGGAGMDAFTGTVGSLGFSPAVLWAWLAALAEGIGGALLILGVLPRINAAAIGCTMAAAIWKVYGASGFFMKNGGFEYQWLILGVCIAIIFSGGKKYSLFDRW
jgi:putative oxidoreductase